MSGLFGVIETGKNSLFVQQSALQILNHNVANAATPGYSRQRVLMGARSILGDLGWPSGDGVEVLGVQRITDRFMVSRLGRAEADLGEQAARVEQFGVLELLFAEPADDTTGQTTLGDALGEFIDSWQLALNPENGDGSGDIRAIILESARQLAQRFGDQHGELLYQSGQLEGYIAEDVDRVNQLLVQVARYNEELAGAPLSESARGNVMDAREQALFELAALAGAEWRDEENGSVTVRIGTRALVQGNGHAELSLSFQRDGAGAVTASITAAGEGTGLDFPAGSLRGRLAVLEDTIPDLIARLDSLAADLMARANSLHQQASGAQGGGIDLFTGTGAGDMALNEVIEGNPELLSTAGTVDDGSSIAEAMFQLHFESMEGGTDTLEDYYAAMIGELGARSATSLQNHDSALRFKQGIQDRLESVTGVSLDEELANMMMVQASFQAASRVIAVADSMLDAILATV